MIELDEFAIEPMAYFSHDSNARDDIKCRRLKRKYGMEGYGRYWQLAEVLASTDGHYLPTKTEDDWEFVADYLEFPTTEQTKEFIAALQQLRLIAPDTNYIWSPRMHENAIKASVHRRGGKKGARNRYGKIETDGESR